MLWLLFPEILTKILSIFTWQPWHRRWRPGSGALEPGHCVHSESATAGHGGGVGKSHPCAAVDPAALLLRPHLSTPACTKWATHVTGHAQSKSC